MKRRLTARSRRAVQSLSDGSALAVFVLAMVGVAAVGAAPVMAQDPPTPSFEVGLSSDGSAAITVTYTFDLTNDAETEAFQSLQDDASAREAVRTRFNDRLQSVARAAANRTGRAMSITDASITIESANGGQTGVARMTATWTGLARSEGDRLVITEPFASEFVTDRRFVVRAPDGYEITAATPLPTHEGTNNVGWAPGTSLNGFEVVMTADGSEASTDTADTSTQTGGQPGFGTVVTIAAVGVLVIGLATVRRVA